VKSESLLYDFNMNLPNPVNFKDPKSGKYLFANALSATLVGVKTPEQMVGLTVRDLNFSRSQSQWGKALAEKIAKMDWLVQQHKCRTDDTAAFLKPDGILIVETVTKLPILGTRGKLTGIATLNQELTHRLSHHLLYGLYKNICGRKIAVQKILRHLEIESYFFAPPTEAELLTLFERVTGKTDKEIAKLHGVSVRTTETHFINLRSKLKGDVLSDIVYLLKNPNHVIDTI